MASLSYEEITAAAARTLRALSEKSAGQLNEDNQSWWDMARGAIRCWEETVGDDAKPEDRRHSPCC